MLDPERTTQLVTLRAALGLEPLDLADLDWALTHRSHVFEHAGGEPVLEAVRRDNERLEFLGDAVLGAVAAEMLYAQYPQASEGELSKLRAARVSRAELGECATTLGLGEALKLGKGERATGGAKRRSTLGSALEAVVGIVYLRLGFARAAEFVRAHVLAAAPTESEAGAQDYKSRLQEWTQRRYKQLPAYRKIAMTGPEHAREFTVQVEIDGRSLAEATGPNLKSAQHAAAKKALELLREEPEP